MPDGFVDNPFSSRRIRPGAIPFLFPAGQNAESLLRQFDASAGRGQIVGPHGSGKSTLLAELAGQIQRGPRRAVLVALHDGQRRIALGTLAAARPGDVVLVDGYEQLGLLARWRLAGRCRRGKLGLLVTAHRPVGLPLLWRTATNAELACRLAEQLLGPERGLIEPAEVHQAFAARRGDLRETLFDLYDLYERRRPAPQAER